MTSVPRMTQPHEMKTKTYVNDGNTVNGNDAWALFVASASGDVSRARTLLAKDRRLANVQYWYQFPIHLAVYSGHTEIVKLLLSHGADPGQSVYTYNSWDKLLRAARERGYLQIESLIQQAMKKRFNYSPDFEVLRNAILDRDLRKVNAVVRKRPELVRESDALGNNALHWSVMARHLGMIDRFVELGTPIDAPRADGKTPILLAVNGATDYWYRESRSPSHPGVRNTAVIVGYLLAKGARYSISVAAAMGDCERVEHAEAATDLDQALSYAAGEGYLHIVRLLLERGANPNCPEPGAPDGTALYNACCGNHLEVARLLLKHGADPNAGVDSCECCLTIGAVYHGDRAKPLQELLRKHGAYTPPYYMDVAELKQAIREKHEVVHQAEFLGNVMKQRDAELLDLYLDSDPEIVRRMNCWSGLIYPRSSSLVRKLLARGLDPDRPDWIGRTFLHVCAESGDRMNAAVFLEAGADINAKEIEFQGTPLATAVRTCCAAVDTKQVQSLRRMIDFLLKRGARTNLPDDESWATPLAWATKAGNKQLADLLKKHGAK